MEFRTITQNDYTDVARIYAEGIATGMATFETVVPDWETWSAKYLPFSTLGVFPDNSLVGWAALSPTSKREVYKGVAEVSIYIDAASRGKHLGHSLLQELIRLSETNGIWSLQAGIFSNNVHSIELHKKCGFRIIGIREQIGCLNGTWYDNVLMERRSKIIGISPQIV